MILKLIRWLVRHKIVKAPVNQTYAVEMQVTLDENTILHKFVAEIEAPSRRAAKWEAKQRSRIKVGAVANKKHLIKNR
jgi:hypothetical protein